MEPCVEGLYCKRPIQCLASSEILTPPPPPGECVHPQSFVRGEDTLAGWRGDGISMVRKAPDTALYSKYIVEPRAKLQILQKMKFHRGLPCADRLLSTLHMANLIFVIGYLPTALFTLFCFYMQFHVLFSQLLLFPSKFSYFATCYCYSIIP